MARRGWLALGALALMVAETHRARARDPGTDLEVGGYEGSASGRFASNENGCTANYPPAAGVRYAGAGAIARVRPDPSARPARGTLITVGVAAEYQKYRRLAPGVYYKDGVPLFDEVPDARPTAVPDHLFRAGFMTTVGYDWHWLGLHGGFLVYNAYDAVAPAHPTYSASARAFPQLLLRVGPIFPVRLELGTGAYSVPTLTRPGAYIGLGVSGPPGSGWDLAVRYAGLDDLNGFDFERWDAEARVPVTDRFRVGAGVAITSGFEGRNEPEGRIVIDFVLAKPAAM